MQGVSVSHLITLFRKSTGETPHQFLLARRIERAEALLRSSDRSITDIAMDLGFSSSQHFATAFKKKKGVTARDVRRLANTI